MKLASTRAPHLIRALETLASRPDRAEIAEDLLEELSGITVLVAKKFTNERSADGLLEACYLTTGCISLAISLADISHDPESELNHLLGYGAEKTFQAGFRLIRELAALPCQAMVSDFDQDPYIQQRNIKSLFSELCRADPNESWAGDETYKNEFKARSENQKIIACAKWLRKNHYSGPIKEADLDANAVVSIAVIFAIQSRDIVARTGQKEIENLIRQARKKTPDIEANWQVLLDKVPAEFQCVLKERMDEYRDKLIRKILSKASVKTVVTEIQNYHAGLEQDVEYD